MGYTLFKFAITQSQYITQSMNSALNKNGEGSGKCSKGTPAQESKTSIQAVSGASHKHDLSQTKGGSGAPKKILRSRSLKKKPDNLEISFELGMMDEHEQIFEEGVKNLLESSLKNVNLDDIESCLGRAFGIKMEVSNKLILQNKFMSAIESLQFEKDLENQEKLEKFLELISAKVPRQFAQELVFLSFLCWEKYIQVRTPIMQSHSLLAIANLFAQETFKKLEKDLDIRFINFKAAKVAQMREPEKVRESFIKFVRIFIGTTFFIIEEYFENPFKERPQIKDKIDFEDDSLFSRDFQFAFDEEFDLNDLPTKKFKYQ